jgi:hypothetical protein
MMTAFLGVLPRQSLCGFAGGDVTMAVAHQVMTLSGTGDAETPAGGSVCMRCTRRVSIDEAPSVTACSDEMPYLEVSHETAARGGRHLVQ